MKKILFSIVFFTLTQLVVNGQGNTSNMASAKSLGLGGASGVFIKDASSSYFNPAVTALLETNAATGGIGIMSSKTAFLNPLYNNSQENSLKPSFIPFHAYGSYQIDYGMVASLAINTPFALGESWGDEWSGRYITQEIRMKTIHIQPTFSYLIREDLSVGAGFVIARSDLKYKHRMPFQDINATFTGKDFGFGFNIGVWGKINDDTEYGVSFKSPISYKYKKGSSQLENIPSLISGDILENENTFTNYKTPYQLSLSMQNKIIDKVTLTYQFDLDGWRVYKELTLDYSNDLLEDEIFIKNYRNSFAFRVGGEYEFADNILYRIGFYYKDSPISDEYLSPDYPDASALGYSTGVTYLVNEELSIDFGINYENMAKRTVLNEQHNFEGVYKTLNYSALIGFNYNF